MIKVCDKYFVGFNTRYFDSYDDDNQKNRQKFPLGYIVKDKTLSSFDSWRDKHLGIKEIDNKPKLGWMIVGDTQRSHDWFGTGRSMLYIQHPEGFVFEISVSNLTNIIAQCNVVDKEFTEQMILAHQGSKLILIPVNSDLYKEAIDDTSRMAATKTKSVIKPSELKIGDVIEFANKTQALFVGRYNSVSSFSDDSKWSIQRISTTTIKREKEKRYFYITDFTGSPRLESVQSPKIYQINKHINLSQEEALKKICKAYRTYDQHIPIIADSVFSAEKVEFEVQICSRYPVIEVNIQGQTVIYKSTYDPKAKFTFLIWLTLGDSKICLNYNEESRKAQLKV
jgi:DNA-directed RNA polymerase subunit H (RpoH/RPB5)